MEEHLEQQSVAERWRSLERDQKISLGILFVCGVAAFFLSVSRVRASITQPFKVSLTTLEQAQKKVNQITAPLNEEAAQKRRDTDGDGFSDWDEVNAYRTSPYLRDTDGDGTPDNIEIANGTDPSCAQGKICDVKIDTSAIPTSTISVPGVDTQNLQQQGGFDQLYATLQRGAAEKRNELIKQQGASTTSFGQVLVRDPEEIRNALRATGQVDEATIKALSDQQLFDIYDRVSVMALQNDGNATNAP